MARRPRDADDDVSLFPFLSILACVIGTLTLMISGLALTQMDTEAVALAEQYSKATSELELNKQEISQLDKKLVFEREQANTDATEQQKQINEAKRKLNELQKQVAKAKNEADEKGLEIVIPEVDLAAHEETVEQLRMQLEGSQEQIAQLESEVDERKLPPKESEVSILPSGSGVGFDPVFVECAEGSIVLHTSATPQRIRTADMAKDKKFVALLKEAAESKTKSMIFLVRNDGLATYNAASRLANANNVRNGKLPVLGKGRIDLSYFLDPENRALEELR